jgi:DNA-directed RNA polymerase specialized sigma24 family protein
MANILTTSELQRIDAIARRAIIKCFKDSNYKFKHSDVEEVILMTNEKVARYWEQYDEEKSKSAWFSLMAYQCACNYMTDETDWTCHHRGMKMTTDDGEVYEVEYADRESPERYQADFQFIVNEELELADKEIDALGERAAQALRLQAIGYSYAEIQDIIGGNANAIKTMVSRGRAQVKKNLGYHMVA